LQASRALRAKLETTTGLPVSMGSDACSAAFEAMGIRRIAVITPYMPVGDKNVARFFEESGYQVRRIKGLRCASPVLIAHTSERQLMESLRELDGDDIDALVQVGTNLAMARLAAQAEVWFKKPVIAINTAIYWHALRDSGITDKVAGFGSLLEKY
jgi:maleate isomerase